MDTRAIVHEKDSVRLRHRIVVYDRGMRLPGDWADHDEIAVWYKGGIAIIAGQSPLLKALPMVDTESSVVVTYDGKLELEHTVDPHPQP